MTQTESENCKSSWLHVNTTRAVASAVCLCGIRWCKTWSLKHFKVITPINRMTKVRDENIDFKGG